MEAHLITRIARIKKRHIPRKFKDGYRLSGPYWYGWYQENGKVKQVYIGKELPRQLEHLIKKRYRKPGYKNYTWPRPRA